MQFLGHIPTAILNNLGFMALLYLIYTTYKHFTVHNASRLFALAAIFQLVGLLHFVISLYLFSNNGHTIINQIAPIHFQVVEINTFLPYIGFTYFLLLLFFSFKTISQFKIVSKYRETANYENSASWNAKLNSTYHTNTNYNIGFSAIVQSPITFGWLDPVIILPIAICNQLSINEIKLILLHEIAHIKRNDYLLHLIIEASHKLLYFNPFSYLFVKEISLQREMSCDALVLAQTANPLSYSKTLYNLAANSSSLSHTNLHLGALNATHELVDRIKHINNLGQKSTKTYGLGIIISALISMLLFTPTLVTKTSNVIKKQSTQLVRRNNEIAETKQFPINMVAEKKRTAKISKLLVVNDVPISNDLAINTPILIVDSLAFINSSPTYAKLVDQTVNWIKEKESIVQFSAYEENKTSSEYTTAEKLLMRAILRNYQLKKALLQDKLIQLENEKQANELLNNSIEWKQMLQYEKWTKEFLKLHPLNFATTDTLRSF